MLWNPCSRGKLLFICNEHNYLFYKASERTMQLMYSKHRTGIVLQPIANGILSRPLWAVLPSGAKISKWLDLLTVERTIKNCSWEKHKYSVLKSTSAYIKRIFGVIYLLLRQNWWGNYFKKHDLESSRKELDHRKQSRIFTGPNMLS